MRLGVATVNLPEKALISEELIKFGLPIPERKFRAGEFEFCNQNGQVFPANITPTSYWPDNSVRWCMVHLLISGAGETNTLYLQRRNALISSCKRDFVVTEHHESLSVSTPQYIFELNSKKLSSLTASNYRGEAVIQGQLCKLLLDDDRLCLGEIEQSTYKTNFVDDGSAPLSIEIEQVGRFVIAEHDKTVARFHVRYLIHYHSGRVDVSLTLHNPKAARHEGGVWDLGDSSSLLFKELSIGYKPADFRCCDCLDEMSGDYICKDAQELSIYQESSGGENWDNSNHVNRNNDVPLKTSGHQINVDGKVTHGKRTQPLVFTISESTRVSYTIKDFWQQFPNEVSVDAQQVTLSFFPAAFPDLHELQPGEKKTHDFSIQFQDLSANSGQICSASPQVLLSSGWIVQCGVIPWFSSDVSGNAISNIIQDGLQGDSSFLAKREIVDQYGWRNFGELYADHEAEGYKGAGVFVSHYNNQYDPVYGLLKQAIISDSQSCLTQAIDLARHVTDIDIYDTSLDKDEYNHGLFWHTDHYQKAETCSHRTYSKLHKSGVYEDHAGGGGPGGQHCYTSGLTLDYWLTGNQQSKNAVIKLTEWITSLYEGKGTLIEFLLSWKNRHNPGLKSFWTGRYPLDRGIGNYINALLDSYELTNQHSYLQRVAHIIRNTVHPTDELAKRNFEDVEETWFYTVFFQAVARYLWVKLEEREIDDDFLYSRDSLSHYALWMSKHERLSLSQPEKLEFPNVTWTAQDLRKVNVLYLAGYFDSFNKASFQAKAEQLYQEVIQGLLSDSSRHSTRVMAILMQNCGVREWCLNAQQVALPEIQKYDAVTSSNWLNVAKRFLSCLSRFSVSKELDQIRRRFPNSTKFVGVIHEEY